MSKYFIKSGRIPSNINFDEIFTGIEGNQTKIQYLKDGMVYFLSKLIFDNYTIIDWKEGVIRLNDKILSEIIGDERPTQITKILQDKGVIEVKPYSKGNFSKGYRLTEKYNTGEFIAVEFSQRIKSKLIQHHFKGIIVNKESELKNVSNFKDFDNHNKESNEKYLHIFEEFEKRELSFDVENVEMFVKKLGIKLFSKTIKLNKKQRGASLKSLFNYIGRLMYLIDDIEKKNFILSISDSNHRFNSNITSLPKILRPYFKINGQNICEVDISSSQPYILSTILNNKFTTSEIDGYNIHTIFSELKEEMKSLKSVIPSNNKINTLYFFGSFMNEVEYTGIERFTQIDFSHDFYDHILSEGIRLHPNYIKLNKGFDQGRDFIKKHIMNFLFDRNPNNRDANDVIGLIKMLYPEACNYVERFHQVYKSTNFALLLQRTESYLILENVCKNIHNQYPEIPFFTIHDSVLTTEPYVEIVKKILLETIYGITGKNLKVKVKKYKPASEISLKSIVSIR